MADKNPLQASSQPFSLFSFSHKDHILQTSILRAFEPPLTAPETYLDPRYPPHHSPPIIRTFNLATFLTLYSVRLRRAAPHLFHNLRTKHWSIDPDSYENSFTDELLPVTGLGFSGSVFYFTADRRYIIKSVGRKFEYTFLYTIALEAQAEHYISHPSTLLARMTDVLFCFDRRIGGMLNLSPAHYIVMENILFGMDKDKGWEKWDLKPQEYFEPIRDLVPDAIKTDAAKTGLADQLMGAEEMIYLTSRQKKALWEILETDTSLLERMRTIDYSILLGRYPYTSELEGLLEGLLEGDHLDFMKGVKSGDGKWVYRMCILDYLWNVDMLAAKITKVAGMIMPEQTVTTEPERYREMFMKMMEGYVIVTDE